MSLTVKTTIENGGKDGDHGLNGRETGENGNAYFSKDSVANEFQKEHAHQRVIKKAKRSVTKVKEDSALVNGVASIHVNGASPPGGNKAPYSKNSRKSRNGFGRGLPKKGGAGGKGTWGKPGCENGDTNGEVEDPHDPNYDSDSNDAGVTLRPISPCLTDGELDEAAVVIIKEFFEHGETMEVVDTLHGMSLGPNRQRVVQVTLTLALERHAAQRELASRLVSDLYGHILSQEQIGAGFDYMLRNLNDLSLDTPDAAQLLGQFIARAIADDALPPKFIASYKGNVEDEAMTCALDKAEVLLSMKHGMVKLDNVWGCGGGQRPVKYLVKQMVLLLREYLDSSDDAEAVRCLQELDVPHFHHELVYQAVVMAIEKSTDEACKAVVHLLKTMTSSNVITPDQYEKGILRVYDAMPDVCIDVPAAYSWLERLGAAAREADILPDRLYKELPAKGRKRFASEGDGGKIKE